MPLGSRKRLGNTHVRNAELLNATVHVFCVLLCNHLPFQQVMPIRTDGDDRRTKTVERCHVPGGIRPIGGMHTADSCKRSRHDTDQQDCFIYHAMWRNDPVFQPFGLSQKFPGCPSISRSSYHGSVVDWFYRNRILAILGIGITVSNPREKI